MRSISCFTRCSAEVLPNRVRRKKESGKTISNRVLDLIRRIDAESITSQRLYQFWQKLRKTSMPNIRVTLHAADRLISLGSPRQALELLETAGDGVRARQLQALALAKTGAIDDAIAELELLESKGHVDAETGGLLAGRYRQKGQQTGLAVWDARARATYQRYFDQTGDTHCGINAAQMALQAVIAPRRSRSATN